MARINLILNPGDFAPVLRPFLKTRRRLVLTTLSTSTLAVGGGFALIYYILHFSTYPTLNLFLILSITILIFPAALFQTILIGDLFFSPTWRKTTFFPANPDDPPETDFKSHNLEFTILIGILFVAQALLLNFGSGNFLRTYNEETFFYIKYQDKDPSIRTWALRQLASPFRYASWKRPGIQKLVLKSLSDPNPETRATGAYLVGFLNLTKDSDKLIKLLADDPSPLVKEHAAEALAKLGLSNKSREVLEKSLKEGHSPRSQHLATIGVLRGLAGMKSSLSTPIVSKVAQEHMGDEVGRNALYALRFLPSEETHTWVRNTLSEPQSHAIQCQLYDLMKFVATTEDVNWARGLFLQNPSNEPCEEVIWEEIDETKHYLSFGDSIRVKLLKIVANTSGAKQRAWFERIVADRSQPNNVREMASNILKAID